MASQHKLSPGDVVAGRYRVASFIGAGGFGEVYSVLDEVEGDRPLALKLHRYRGGDEPAIDVLRDEFALLASLSHPNLAQVHDFGFLGERTAFFTQALVVGRPLRAVLGARGTSPLHSERAVRIVAQVCSALDYLRDRGVLHRDLKPENVLVGDEDHVTLVDFGLARGLEAPGSELAGTYEYMAPEVIAGGPVDSRADVYSLGVVLYELVTGHPPYEGERARVLAGHLFGSPQPISADAAPAALASLVHAMLDVRPDARPSSGAEILERLAAACGVATPVDIAAALGRHVSVPPFVGRDEELHALLGRLRSGHVTLVSAGPGAGKSRLLREVRHRAQLDGHPFVTIDAHRVDGPDGLAQRLLSAVVTPAVAARLDDADRRVLAMTLPRLRRRGEATAVALDPDRAMESRVHAIVRALELRFAARPGVIAIEDLHWLPLTAIDLFALVTSVAARARAPVAFVTTARPGPPCERFASRAGVHVIALGELSATEARAVVAAAFGDPNLLAGTELGDASSGASHSPLWLVESLRLALERGAIVRCDGRWTVKGRVPREPLATVIDARLALLSGDGERVVIALAVLGRPATVAELAAVSEMPPSRTARAVRELLLADVLEERVDDARTSYLVHDLLADRAIETASPTRVRHAHLAAARVERSRGQRDFRSLARAARHFAHAGDERRAASALEAAERRAESGGRPDVALLSFEERQRLRGGEPSTADLLRRYDLARRAGNREIATEAAAALRSLGPRSDPALRVAVARRRADADALAGDGRSARRRARAAYALARSEKLAREQIDALLLLADIDNAYGNVAAALDAARMAADEARVAGEAHLEARACHRAALLLLRSLLPEEAKLPAIRAVALARELGDRALLAEASMQLGSVLRETGHLRASASHYRRAILAARSAGALDVEAKTLSNLGITLLWLNRAEDAESAYRRSIDLKDRIGAVASALVSRNNLAALLIGSGRLDAASVLLNESLEAAGSGAPTVTSTVLSNLADVALLEGDLDLAIERYRKALALLRSQQLIAQGVHTVSGLIRALAMRRSGNDLAEAMPLLDDLRTITGSSGTRVARRYHVTAAVLADAAGDERRMLEHARLAAADRGHVMELFGVVGTPLEARWLVALSSSRAGRGAAAQRGVSAARRRLERIAGEFTDPERRRGFLEGHPLRRTIVAGELGTRPGWTWLP